MTDTPPHGEPRITISARNSGKAVSPTMFGLFFEDINYGADGGLYAELVQNRSFEHEDSLHAWSEISLSADGDLKIATSGPLNANNPHYLHLHVREAGDGYGLANDGFDGIPIREGKSYRFSVHARSDQAVPLKVILQNEIGNALGECVVEGLSPEWQRFECTIPATAGALRGRLTLLAIRAGTVDLDMVSLFPEETWKGRTNGLRADLVQLLAEMRPGFLRFPGGCIVEGKDLGNAYRWKETIGDVAERRQNWNRWMNALPDVPAPQYYQTYGLGFFEYFLLSEDLGAEPVPILNCGMSCQFQDANLVPVDQLDSYVQDMLDLIEFANGPIDSPWGAKRAAMGHPDSFRLKYLGIGNEQWGEEYFERYPVFYEAIKAKHPEIQLITTAGPAVDNHSGHVSDGYEKWKLAWDKFEEGMPADIVDEHYYCKPQWFLDNADRYDAYDPNGPKVFAGEYAAHDEGSRNNLRCALAEAALITGLLRNADIVTMASYAPLFARAGFTQWKPDLIWFDATRAYGTPSYHVQAMFSRNRPDVVMPLEIQNANRKELFAVAGRDDKSGELLLFVVNAGESPVHATVDLADTAIEKRQALKTMLTSDSLDDENSFDDPTRIAPTDIRIEIAGSEFEHDFAERSFTVLRI